MWIYCLSFDACSLCEELRTMMGSFFWSKRQIIFPSGLIQTPVKTGWVDQLRLQIKWCELMMIMMKWWVLKRKEIYICKTPLRGHSLLQVFFYKGELHILPCPSKSNPVGIPKDVVPTVAQALAQLSTHPQACRASPKICSAVRKRLEGWEDALKHTCAANSAILLHQTYLKFAKMKRLNT